VWSQATGTELYPEPTAKRHYDDDYDAVTITVYDRAPTGPFPRLTPIVTPELPVLEGTPVILPVR
jgi:hypothetical protein